MPSLIDRSPGAFITVAGALVYGVSTLIAVMCTTASAFAVAGVIALVLVTAGLIGRAVWRLMDDEDGSGFPVA